MSEIRADDMTAALRGAGATSTAGIRAYTQAGPVLTYGELDAYWAHSLCRRIVGELVQDASTEVMVTGQMREEGTLDPAPILDALEVLDAQGKLTQAGIIARHYGGAAVWMITDVKDTSNPIKPGESIRRLMVLDRFELQAAAQLEVDLASPAFGLPTQYTYRPLHGGEERRIHHSRLIRMVGEATPERQASFYEYWGASALESVVDALSRYDLVNTSGAALLGDFGALVFTFGNMVDMLERREGRTDLERWLGLVDLVKSLMHGFILGPGQTLETHSPNLSGWVDIYDRLAQALAAAARMPITKLYGQAPGGLSTDDASAQRNWSARVKSYQGHALRPAYNRLLEVMFADLQGPTHGIVPARWHVEFEPYDVPTPEAQAALTKTRTESLMLAHGAGALSIEEVRANLETLPGMVLMQEVDEEETHAQVPQERASAPVSVAAEDVQKSVLNGAQITSLVEVVSKVNAGEVSPQSAVEILAFSLNVPREEAKRMVGLGKPTALPGATRTALEEE